jgi:hypothetical protein
MFVLSPEEYSIAFGQRGLCWDNATVRRKEPHPAIQMAHEPYSVLAMAHYFATEIARNFHANAMFRSLPDTERGDCWAAARHSNRKAIPLRSSEDTAAVQLEAL